MRWRSLMVVAGLALLTGACGTLLDTVQVPVPTASVEATTIAITPGGAEPAAASDAGAVRGVAGVAGRDDPTATPASVAASGYPETKAETGTVDVKVPGPLGADMLLPEERHRAEYLVIESDAASQVLAAAADRDERLASLSEAGGADAAALTAMSERPTFRVLYSQRYPQKDGAGRAAEVLVYRYDTGQIVRAKVDLATNAVEALPADPSFPLPVTPDEIQEATIVARADAAVRTALSDAGLDADTAPANGILTGTDDPTSPCAGRRCLRLFFSSLREPAPRFTAIVDMAVLKAIEVVPMPGGSVQP